MPFEGEKTAADLAEWTRGVPVLGWAVDNVFYAAILVTTIALIVVMSTYWYRPAGESGWKTRVRVGIYTFLGTFLLLFVRRQGLITEGRREVRGGRLAKTLDQALSGSYTARGGGQSAAGVGRFIVGGVARGGRMGGGDSSGSDSSSDSGSDSDSDADAESQNPVPVTVGGTIVPRPDPAVGEPFSPGQKRAGERKFAVPGVSAAPPATIGGVPIATPVAQAAYIPPAPIYGQPPGVTWGAPAFTPQPVAGVGHIGMMPLPGAAPVVV